MKAHLKELQSRLLGSVTDAAAARDYFATDGSIFRLEPEAVVYPKNTADVRKALAYLTERAEAGKPAALTPRGRGTDQGGGALGDGLQLVLPAHMNRLLKLEKDTVTVQPGILYQTLQQTLHTHGRFLPPYPSSIDYSTIGGAVANNAAGEKSFKYGVTRDFVKHLKVVLADGSLIETKRISGRELNRKKGLSTLEGAIYRGIDSLVIDNTALIREHAIATTKNTAGYALSKVRGKDGSFDLSQLIIGSQGTLGVVTEVTLRTLPHNPRTTLVALYFDDLKRAGEGIARLRELKPSALELVDYYLLDFLRTNRPQDLGDLLPEELPKVVVLCEFDDTSQLSQTMKARRAQKIGAKFGTGACTSTDPVEQEALWKIRHSAAAVIWMTNGTKKALPFIEDGIVPPAKLPEFLDGIYQLLARYDLQIAVWGHAGDANLHLQPFIDITKKKEVDKLYELSRDFTKLVIKLGGSTAGEHNDGLVRAPYLKDLYGTELYGLFEATKRIFDPHAILNPRVKIGVTEEYARSLMRDEYSMRHLYDHMPRT